MILDGQEYYNSTNLRTIGGQTVYANNYAESNIRKWLNDTFYNTAFTETQKQVITLTNVDNSVNSTRDNYDTSPNPYVSSDTEDYV